MDICEGAKRMRWAGFWIAVVPMVSALALLGRSALSASYHMGGDLLEPTVLDLLTLTVPGVLLWFAGWIADGFTKDIH
jgi:hypothetical protein